MDILEETDLTTSNGFQIVWDYDHTLSRVTEWVVRHSQQVEVWREKVIADSAARSVHITLSESELGTLYAVEIIAMSDGVSSKDIGRIQVTIREYTKKMVGRHLLLFSENFAKHFCSK